MGLGDLTKQLAKEALGSQVDGVMESLRAPEATPKTAPQAPSAESLAAVVMGEVQAMQNALKDDQELVVTCTAGRETLRVLEIFAPSPRLLVLSGVDTERAVVRVVSAADQVQLVCKPSAVKEGAKPARLRFVAGKPKPINP